VCERISSAPTTALINFKLAGSKFWKMSLAPLSEEMCANGRWRYLFFYAGITHTDILVSSLEAVWLAGRLAFNPFAPWRAAPKSYLLGGAIGKRETRAVGGFGNAGISHRNVAAGQTAVIN